MTGADLIEMLQLPFVSRAVFTIALLALISGVAGLLISFRNLEFLTDGVVHAVFPGLVIGYALGGSALLLPGALVAGLLAAILIAWFTKHAGTTDDSAIAVVLTGAFSIGVVLVSKQDGYTAELTSLLFGQLLTVTDGQLLSVAVLVVVGLCLLLYSWRTQLYRAFDPVAYRASGGSIMRADMLLGAATAITVVAGVQALGNLLVIALLIVPTAAAKQVTQKIVWIVVGAILITLCAGTAGIILAVWAGPAAGINVSAGPTVVLLLVLVYLVCIAARTVTQHRRVTRELAHSTTRSRVAV